MSDTIQDRATLCGMFLTGCRPTESNFNDLITTVASQCGDNFISGSCFCILGGNTFTSQLIVEGQSNITCRSLVSVSNSVAVGFGHNIESQHSLVAGGMSNVINSGSDHSTIMGGSLNCIGLNSLDNTIINGSNNLIVDSCFSATVSGEHNTICGLSASGSIIGSNNSQITGSSFSTILGARDALVYSSASNSILGGICNSISGEGSTIIGGGSSVLNGCGSIISGGCYNNIAAHCSVIAGGAANVVNSGDGAFIGAGNNNNVASYATTVVAGQCNKVDSSSPYSFIGAGINNSIAISPSSIINGGSSHCINSSCESVIIGGCCNFIVGGTRSTASGAYAYVTHDHQFSIGGGLPGLGSQVSILQWWGETTDDVQTEIFIRGPTSTMATIESGRIWHGHIDFIGIKNDFSKGIYGRKSFAIANNGGTTSMLGSSPGDIYTTDDFGASGYSISISADDASDYLKIEVTGGNAEVVRWKVSAYFQEMPVT